jgi:methylthioribose-1-phosphate isomerase
MKGILIHGVPEDTFYDLLKSMTIDEIYIPEGRPYLEGAREVAPRIKSLFPNTILISDNMISYILWKKLVERVYIFYQNINEGEAKCKIGSLVAGIVAEEHGIPVYLYRSKRIYEDYGKDDDVCYFDNKRVAPLNVNCYNPLVDIVPLDLITMLYKDGKWINLKKNY